MKDKKEKAKGKRDKGQRDRGRRKKSESLMAMITLIFMIKMQEKDAVYSR